MGILTLMTFRARLLSAHAKTERGASLVEYALLIALITVVCIAAVSTFHQELGSNFSSSAESL